MRRLFSFLSLFSLVAALSGVAQAQTAVAITSCAGQTLKNGQKLYLTTDLTGQLCISNNAPSAGSTGSAVPSKAEYEGLNVGGTLRGATAVNPSGTVYAQQIDITSIAGTTVVADEAIGAASVNNPTYVGTIFETSPATVTTGQRTALHTTNDQRLLTTGAGGTFPVTAAASSFAVGSIPPSAGTLSAGAVTSAMTGTTSTSVIAGTASNYIYLTQCTTSNASLTVSTDILLQDGSGGTTLYVLPAPAAAVATTGGGGSAVSFPVPLKVTTSGNGVFAANVTTGSSTKISCSGFKSTVSY